MAFVIAEAGVNHNGELALALQLVEVAAEAGAHAVKFQTFSARALASASAPKAAYQRATTGAGGSQLAMLEKLELSEVEHRTLQRRCEQLGIEFISTPFGSKALELLIGLGVKRLKLGSGDVTNGPLLLQAARTGLPVILSTGMSSEHEVADAVGVLAFGWTAPQGATPSRRAFDAALTSVDGRAAVAQKLVLLQCTTEYPAPIEQTNLRVMDTLEERFGCPTGLSDHTAGIYAALAAVARGAAVIEKHFTLDRTLPGPDHRASLEPMELAALVRGVRAVQSALGSPQKAPTAAELGNRVVARRSLVAARPIPRGRPLTEQDLAIKRPGGGISPMRWWQVLGEPAPRDFDADEPIDGLEELLS